MTPKRLVLSVLLLALVVGLVVPAASAGSGAGSTAQWNWNQGSTAAQPFPAWYPPPNSSGVNLGNGQVVATSSYYRANLAPTSNAKSPEITDFGCNYPATYIDYRGQPVTNPFAGQPIAQGAALKVVINTMNRDRTEYWATLNNTSSNTSAQAAELASKNLLYETTAYAQTSGAHERVLMAPASQPVDMTRNIPSGCDLRAYYNDTFSSDSHKFGALLQDPMNWVMNLTLYFLGSPTTWVYSKIAPSAFAYGFWTPHSERGDLMFLSAKFSCGTPNPGTSDPAYQAYVQAQDYCTTTTVAGHSIAVPLGYSKTNNGETSVKPKTPSWVQWSIFFQWLISATYFVILAGGAVIYMSRADHKSSYTIVKLMPRLLLSMILTILLNFAMGEAISISNYLVQMIFGQGSVLTVHGITDIFLSLGQLDASDPVTHFASGLAEILLITLAIFYLARLLLFAIWRQMVLLLMIVFGPFAMFSVIHPRLQAHFWKYLKGFAALMLAPFVMAFILRLGVGINPILQQGNIPGATAGDFTTTMLGALMLLVTFHFMLLVPRICKAVVKGEGIKEGAMGKVGGMVKSLGWLAPPGVGLALQGVGGAMQGASALGNRHTAGMAELIPSHKIRSSISGGSTRSSGFGRMMGSELAGDAAGLGAAALLGSEGGIKSGMAGAALGAAAGGVIGGPAGMAAGLLTGGLAGGTSRGTSMAGIMLGGMFAANSRTQQHFSTHSRRYMRRQGIVEINREQFEKLMAKQQTAELAARAKAEASGQEFNRDDWLQKVAWSKKGKDGGLGLQRLHRAGSGPSARYFIAQPWSQAGQTPMADYSSRVGPGPRWSPTPDMGDVVDGFAEDVDDDIPDGHFVDSQGNVHQQPPTSSRSRSSRPSGTAPPWTPAAAASSGASERRSTPPRRRYHATTDGESRLDLRGFDAGSAEGRAIKLGVDSGYLQPKHIRDSMPGMTDDEAEAIFRRLQDAGVVDPSTHSVDIQKVRRAYGVERFGVTPADQGGSSSAIR